MKILLAALVIELIVTFVVNGNNNDNSDLSFLDDCM